MSTSLLEIASRCSFYHRNWKGFRPSIKRFASGLSYLLLQLCSNDGETSLPEKGTMEATSCRREVTCVDTDMD